MRHPFALLTVEHLDLVGTYPDRQSALDVVRETLERYGDDDLQSVALARINLRSGMWPIAVGPDLIALAQSEPAQPGRERRLRRRRAGGKVTAHRGRVGRRATAVV